MLSEVTNYLLCTGVSLALGLAGAFIYMFKNTYSKGFVITLALLPAMVQVVIMLVNGNLGAGVAVMGAFSLIRFRSVPGSAREISSIFLAMAVGLATGMHYLTIAVVFTVVLGLATILLNASKFGEQRQAEKHLLITIPEGLDYTDIFDDLFGQFLSKWELVRVKTASMGSLYKLEYHIVLKDMKKEKEMIDALRCRNGNLEISCGRAIAGKEEL